MNERKSKPENRNSQGFPQGELRTRALVLVLAALFTNCRHHAPSVPPGLIPAGNLPPGWVKSSGTRTFDANHLWEYIDGDADKFVQAGVVMTLTSDYRFHDKSDATLDVYLMGDPAGAQKVYDSESAAGSQPLTLGDVARYAKGSLTFRQGPYFIRLVAFQDTPETAASLTALARAISGNVAAGSPHN